MEATETRPETPSLAPQPGPAPAGALRRFLTLTKKELRAYFNTPTAYIVVTVFLLITGWLFSSSLFLAGTASLSSLTGIAPLLLVFFVPAVTMRLVSEELKTGTFELLATLPVEDLEIVLSKYAAALAVVAFALAGTLPFVSAIAWLGDPDGGAVAGTYLGLFLSGAVLAAAGLLASTLTRNQIVAFILGFLACFTLYLAGEVVSFMPPWAAPVAEWLGLRSHLETLGKGVVDVRDLVYYASVSGYFLFLAYLNLESRRWRL